MTPRLQDAELLSISADDVGDGTALRVTGEIDLSNASLLGWIILIYQQDLEVLDLTRVRFIDCRGFQVLVTATARARARGERLPILAGPAVQRLVSVLITTGELDLTAVR